MPLSVQDGSNLDLVSPSNGSQTGSAQLSSIPDLNAAGPRRAPQQPSAASTSAARLQAEGLGAPQLDEVHNGTNLTGLRSDFEFGFDDSSLAYFLNDIMLSMSPLPDGGETVHEQAYASHIPRDFLDFGTFAMDPELGTMLNATDGEVMPLPTAKPLNAQQGSGARTPIFADGMLTGQAAFLQSMWTFTPTAQHHIGEDHLNLSLPYPDMETPETRAMADCSISHHVDNKLRDKILASVLSACDPSVYTTIVSSFPSADMLDKLLHFYIAIHLGQPDSWLHFPTMDFGDESLELVIMMISAGAVMSSVSSVRRLGFALQETSRIAIAKKVSIICASRQPSDRPQYERDNRFTRDLATLQASALQIQVGLWSGDKRKMEIAESFAQPLITASISRGMAIPWLTGLHR